MTRPKPSVSSTTPVLQTVAWLNKQGFKPVALHPSSKAAIDRTYVDADYRPPLIELWQTHDFGVGVVTGPRASGPADVDLDCPEAVYFAQRFLPPTPAMFGRLTKRQSHYWYKLEEAEFAKVAFIDPITSSTIIELRTDGGHQTVCPGSLHQDTGELIEWHSVPFPDVPRVSAHVLARAVKKVATAVLVARHLWHDGQRNDMVKHLAGTMFYSDWTVEEAVQFISAITDFLGDTDKTRIRTVNATYKKGEKGNKITGAGTLRKVLADDRLVDKLLEWVGTPASSVALEYNERFTVVNLAGKFRVASTDVEPGSVPTFYMKEDFINLYGTDYLNIDGKNVPKPKIWLANDRRRSCTKVDFLPGMEDSGDVLNLWTGWNVQPNKEAKCEAWLELLSQVICGGEEALTDWMLQWFASILREPRNSPLTAPVIIGRPGAGKSLLLTYFGEILGSPTYTVATNEEHVYGKFNMHLGTTLLLHSEEALYAGELRHRGIIKSLITDKFRIFESKGIDARQVRNYLRLVLTSNYQHAAPAEAGDRRYTVIDLDDRKISDQLRDAVLMEMEKDGPAGLFNFLLERDYDRKVPRVNVKNEALRTTKLIGATPEAAWWYETLESGNILPDFLCWCTRPEREAWPAVVGSVTLYKWACASMRERGARFQPNEVGFYSMLSKFVGHKFNKGQRDFVNPCAEDLPQWAKQLPPGRQNAILNLPNLIDCRQAFEDYIGQSIDWPDEGEPPQPDKF